MNLAPRAAEAGLLYCSAIWGSTFIVVKDTVASVDPFVLNALRFLLSALALAPWALRRERPWEGLKQGAGLGVLLLALYAFQTVGLKETSAANSGFITGLFIFFVPLFLFVFKKQKPAAGQCVSVLIALGGLWLLTGGVKGFGQGDALTVAAAAAYAGHLLATDKALQDGFATLPLAFHQFWICGAAFALIAALQGTPFAVPGTGPKSWIVFLALFPNLSAFFIQLEAQKSIAPIKTAMIFSLEPVFAALFAWTLGGEAVTAANAAGGLFIVAAMILSERSRLRSEAQRESRTGTDGIGMSRPE